MLQGQCLHVVRLWCGTGFAMWSAICHFVLTECLCYCTQNWIRTDGLFLFTTPQVCYEWMIVGVGRKDGGWWRHLATIMRNSLCSWWSLWFERSVLYLWCELLNIWWNYDRVLCLRGSDCICMSLVRFSFCFLCEFGRWLVCLLNIISRKVRSIDLMKKKSTNKCLFWRKFIDFQ